MPRQRRIIVAGGIYHVIQRGIEGREIFVDDTDHREFVKRLEAGLKETGSKCYGWVLMPNHFHLVIRTGIKPISELMRKVLTGYAVYFNRRYRRSGHLYQNRYKAILCDEEKYMLELVRYVHLNPLRGKIVKDMEELSLYPWSGHRILMGEGKAAWQSTGEVLERFGERRNAAIRKYEDFVAEGKGSGRRYDLSGGGLKRSAGAAIEAMALKRVRQDRRSDERVLGDGHFVESVLKQHEEQTLRREYLRRQGWDINKLIDYVCTLMKVSKESLRRKGRRNTVTYAKGLIAYWGKQELGMNGAEIGDYLGASRQAVSMLCRKGERYISEKAVKLTY